jgi:hypothetical protein
MTIAVAPGRYVEWIADEAIVLEPDTGRLHYLNAPAALMYGLIAEFGYAAAVVEFKHRTKSASGADEALAELVAAMLEKRLAVDD